MRGGLVLILTILLAQPSVAATITDATGRAVQVPDTIAHVLPAGPPAAVLLEIIAPDLMIGWPEPVSAAAQPLIAPGVATLPVVPRITGREDVSDKVEALHPDLIVDYGTVSPRYADLAKTTQQKTGVPTILLDGSLDKTPETLRMLGQLLHRQDRAEILARFAAALLAFPAPAAHPSVVYARGADGLTVAAPGTDVTEIFAHLGWKTLAPEGKGAFRTATVDAIRQLDPDILIFADPAMKQTLKSDVWQSLRAVKQGHAIVAPSLPFGWIEEPPSVNRLVGLAWLSGREPETLAALSNAVLYGHTLTSTELDTVLGGTRPFQP